MKKIIILAYDFPPYVSVGGLRPFSWFKYFHEFGVFPVLFTRQWSNSHGDDLDYISPGESDETIIEKDDKGIIFRTPFSPTFSNRLQIRHGSDKYRLSRKLMTSFYEFGQYFFSVGPKLNLYSEAEKYLSENKADLIIATGEPYILFNYAAKLSKKFSIPWIADYRDPWTQDKKRRDMGIPEFADAFLEKKTLSGVDAITTVSMFFQKKIENLITNKPIYIIPNGYDPEAIESVKEVRQTDEKLSIGFVGTIYDWHPLENFLRVCNDFAGSFDREPIFRINFYGINLKKEILELVARKFPHLESVVTIFPKLPNRELLEKLASNNVFLLFNYYSYMGTKIYDYLGLKRRIILCYSNDDEARKLKEKFYNMQEDAVAEHLQEQIIKETNSGIIVENAEHLRTVLGDLYSEFKEKRYIISDSINTEQFSRKVQVGNLADVIDKTISSGKEKYS